MRIIADDAALERLWPAWEALWRRAARPCPFVSPAWLRPWWRVFGTGQPVVAVLEGATGLAGLLPLYRLDGKLLPMGVGLSDYFDVLVAADAPPYAAECLLAAALPAGGCCDMPDLPADAALRRVAAPPGWVARDWDGPDCPVLTLTPAPAIPAGMRRDLRQARHRAERAGGARFADADDTAWPKFLLALIELHAARWRERGQTGVLGDATVRAFHEAATPGLLRAGVLRLTGAYVRGRIAGVVHALLSPGRLHFYLGGFDPAASHESPGTLLIGHMVEQAAAEGRAEVHFLRGGEAYKYAWGARPCRNIGRSWRVA